MKEGNSVSKREETVSAEPEDVESVGGEMTEDELNEAVGGVGSEEQPPQTPGEGSGRGWWHDPND